MKNLGFAFAAVVCLIACNDNVENQVNTTIDGSYVGHFDYHDTSYWCAIELKNGKYEEFPSGGVYMQKPMYCLTVGEFSIQNKFITFQLDSFKYPGYPKPCKSGMPLPGNYEILYQGPSDSLVFKKRDIENDIIYYLNKVD